MNQLSATLKEVDRIEIVTIIDNYMDVLLENTDVVTRPPHAKGGEILTDALLAEHGLSLLVTVYQGEKRHTILFDTGYTQIGVPHNLELLEVDTEGIEAIVLSHGHMDHTGSLYPLLDRIGRHIPLVVHPDAFIAPRYLGLDDGSTLLFPQTLIKADLEAQNIELLAKKTPSLLADDRIMVTGEVERVTEFEKGMPNALMERDGKLDKDPISDDQALVINLKGKGLVVIGGCSHAGIINTILYAQKMTGIEQIYAVLGGFHLSGASFEPIIEETINELKKMRPKVLVPMHCTGWKANHRFSEEFPSSFILNSVGSLYTLT